MNAPGEAESFWLDRLDDEWVIFIKQRKQYHITRREWEDAGRPQKLTIRVEGFDA